MEEHITLVEDDVLMTISDARAYAQPGIGTY